jgi:hypothetical protein
VTNCYCGAPAPDAWLCKSHDLELEQRLSELPALVDDLQAHIGRQLRFSTGRIGGRSSETQLPVRVDNRYYLSRASTLAADLRNVLVGVIRHLVESRGVRTMPADDLSAMASWVGARARSVCADETASETLHDIRRLSTSILTVVDRPADLTYLGICSIDHGGQECPSKLYAPPEATHATCETCGWRHDVEQRRAVLRERARDTLMTIPELKDALPEVLGVPINHSTLRSWKARKRIVPHGKTEGGDDLFNVGEVLDIATQTQAEAS